MSGRMKTVTHIGLKISVQLLALTFCLVTCCTVYAASMDKYVKKYNGVEISQSSVAKLARFNDYIYYFSNFAFYKPRHKVSPDFIKAMILAESSTNPRALSNKNARGLTQILPETGKRAAKELYNRKMEFTYVSREKLKDLQPDDLYDPATNILLACYLISKYNHDYNGQLELVVAAWNAGRNSITDDLQPPDYQETLDLIGKINGYFIYLLDQQKLIGPDLATR